MKKQATKPAAPGKAIDAPSVRMLQALQGIYGHFNTRLFAGELPEPLFNLSRTSRKTTVGFLAPEAWVGEEGRLCELSITPFGTTRGFEDICSTLVHEMVHQLEYVRGKWPKTAGYHSDWWWDEMERIGLPPIDVPGKKSRIHVDNSIAPDGAFAKAFAELPPALRVPFTSVEGAGDGAEDGEGEEKESKQGKRAKYVCGGTCGTTMRGPSGRRVICGDCEEEYVEVGF